MANDIDNEKGLNFDVSGEGIDELTDDLKYLDRAIQNLEKTITQLNQKLDSDTYKQLNVEMKALSKTLDLVTKKELIKDKDLLKLEETVKVVEKINRKNISKASLTAKNTRLEISDLSLKTKQNNALAKSQRYLNQQVKYKQSIKAKQDAINKALKDAGLLEDKNTKKVNNQSKVLSKAKGALATFVSFRTLGNLFGTVVNQAGGWIENLNLFSVTFNDQAEEMLDWALDFSNQLGVSNNEIVKMAGLFKQVSRSIGITDDTSDALSKTLTQLTYDIASFYNIADEKAVSEKLQSGIFAGQIRSVRAFGFDVSQESVQTLLDTNEELSKLGLNARNLTQAQKAIARTMIVLRDGANSFGDMARTIDTLQNRVRVLKGSFENLKLAIGSAFEGVVSDLIATATGIIQAITTIVNGFSGGIRTIEKETKSITEDLGDAVEEAEDKANNLSFDKFETLTSSENEDKTATDALNNELQKQIALYDEVLSKVSGIDEKVQSVKNAILDFVFPDRTEEDLGNMNSLLIMIGTVFGSVASLGVLGFVGKLSKGISTLSKTLEIFSKFGLVRTVEMLEKTGTSLGGITKILSTISAHPIIAIITLVVGLLTALYFGNEQFRESVNKLFKTLSPLVEMLGEILSIVLDIIVSALQPVINLLGGVLGLVIESINMSLATMMVQLVPVLYIFEAILKVVQSIVVAIKDLLSLNFSNFAKNQKDIWSNWASNDFAKSAWGNFTGALGFENGGIPNKSELFYMNENGVPEALINTGGSQTNVVNMQQLRQMTKEGFIEAIRETGLGDGFKMVVEGRNIDNSSIARGIFPALKIESKRQGGNQL